MNIPSFKGFKQNKKNNHAVPETEGYLLTDDSPFAVQEAYKTLRTNLIFSVPDGKCKTIVITSSIQGEAKSTTACNLAIAFAQNKSKVLLIDADLRLPTIANKLNVPSKPGLSNFLAGMNEYNQCVHHLDNGLDFIPSGDVPPNPTELLGSGVMQQFLEALEGVYEYIIIDTPPITTVADAAIISKRCSGVALVVRQHIASRESVNEALTRLKFADAKILGIIFTGVENEKLNSYRKKGYGYRYGSSKTASADPADDKK